MSRWLLLLVLLVTDLKAEEPYLWENTLTLESISNLSGGIERGSVQLANLDVSLAIDTESAGWWKNGEVFVYLLGDYGRKDPAELTGGLQGISNIAADNAIKIYEFWYQHYFLNDHIKLLTGLHDFNSTFYSLESAGLFNHPSFGIGPDTSQVTPSIFPTSAWTLHLTVNFENLYVLAAVYDGVPGDPENPRGTHIQFNSGDGLFSAIEVGMAEEHRYKLGMGYWTLTATTENPIDASQVDSNYGFYVIGEKYLTDNVAIFFQIGQADDSVNQLANYYGGGIVVFNAFADGDAIGLAYADAKNGDPFLNANPELSRSETAIELSYNYPWSDAFSSQLSLYQIKDPDMNETLDDAYAAGVRLTISF